MEARLGIGGWYRSMTAAIFDGGRLRACEEGRLRRMRQLGANSGGWPALAIEACATMLGARAPAQWLAAEEQMLTLGPGGNLIDHHVAHARTAFGTSGFRKALVVICDSHKAGSESLWLADEDRLERINPRHAIESGIAPRLAGSADPREIEFLARNARETGARARLTSCAEEVLQLIEAAGPDAESLPICAGGGLFLNGFINLRMRQEGYWVHIAPDPTNGGLAVGCALPDSLAPFRPGPFLGPSFSDDEIKRVLDNCKVRYEYVSEDESIVRSLEAILRGQLVGWFHGPMEWGPRALGNRSILANPFSRYVSDNLNTFLKHRPLHHTYPLSILEEDLEALLSKPVASPFMESEGVIPPDGPLAQVAQGGDRLRVQTVSRDGSRLSLFLQRFKETTGYGALVNTSFNGFHEPIVATPRDAVRVFYGTGIDALSIGSFWLEK